MLTDRTHSPLRIDEVEPAQDRAMLILQYLTAAIAVIAAVLLAFLR
jgi:hypothetical protein